MKKVLPLLASRQSLAVFALVVVSLAIWFCGPLVSFGGLKPFDGVGMRVLAVALSLAGVLLWLVRWSMSTVLVALLCLVIWYASPLLAFGGSTPFALVPARLTAIGLVLAAFAVRLLIRLQRRMRDDKTFLAKLLHFGCKQGESPAAPRLQEVTTIVSAALARLKAMRTGATGLGKLFQGQRYLYEVPWYLTLGSKGSGKTSALRNGGMSFPVAEQMQRAAGTLQVDAGALDWRLTNEAVLIDTPGYYARHGDSPVRSIDGAATNPAAQAVTGKADEAVVGGQDKAGESSVETKVGPATADVNAVASGREAVVTAANSNGAGGPKGPASDIDRRHVDREEWLGFLSILRQRRPLAPINGVLLAVDVASLVSADEEIRAAEASALHARLVELREELGIRFPVYLLITKMDRLAGFTDYVGTMTSGERVQKWGFPLPHGKRAVVKEELRARCHAELRQLADRLADTVEARMQDQYDPRQRKRLSLLPEEFPALIGPLVDLIERAFLDSRYDTTELHSSLRGVYFTSALQRDSEIVAERRSVVQRLASTQEEKDRAVAVQRQEGHQSYFLHDLFKRVIFPESHLVTPNLRWEHRSRLARLLAHTLVIAFFAWLAMGLYLSFGHNQTYAEAIGAKARPLAARVAQLYKEPKPQAVPDTLSEARDLPTFPGLNLSDPDTSWRYGLYTPPNIVAESRRTYDALEDRLLLPQIVQRMEAVLTKAIADKDAKTAYDALRVYLMLYDKAKFHADDVEAWVLDDWAKNDSAAVFGGRASMIEHVQQLFSGKRIVQSSQICNDALIQQARAFLDGSNATDRLYQRAKTAMMKEAPDEFTLLRAVGPQAGTVFTRASGAPISRGVPGLFTFDGYRNLFDKRLPEFIQAARKDDAWVMGRSYLGNVGNVASASGAADAAQKKTAEIASAASGADDALTRAVRREYLMEYAQQWDAFLGDIRSISGTSLAFNLQVLRSLAAPDSPLARLARAAVHETTLTAPVAGADGSLLQKAADQLSQKANKALGIRASERIERELVDNHFAALREVVTGSADAQTGDSSAPAPSLAQARTSGLDGVASLLNDYYTALTVSNNALSTNSLPPTSDAAVKLKLTADTMPAPFQAVLLQIAVDGSREVNEGIGQLLSRQMQSVVGDTCRLTIEGNYPFAPQSTRDVSLADFTRLFAQGGVIDDFFTKTLAPFVDTAAKPWRYRTLPGATEPVQGPDLEPFEHAQAIRDIFFDDPDHKQLRWQAQIRIPELDPTITTLSMDIDGQPIVYQHGPVMPFAVTWPGPRGGAHAEISASPRIAPDSSTLAAEGPWALMRLLHKGHVIETATLGRTRVAFEFDGRKAALDVVSAASVANPLTSDVLSTFRCPTSMPMFNLTDSGPPPGLPSGGVPMPTDASAVSR
jgi:type VI secretion system protein ImpL